MRMYVRQILTRCGVGRLRREVPRYYAKATHFRTKYTEGVIPEGRALLRCYKNAAKEVRRWQDKRENRYYFYVWHEKPTLRHPGYLEVRYVTGEDEIEGEEF